MVTAVVGGEPAGMVVGSFISVSLDPPLVAYAPAKSSRSYAQISASKSFCVNVLSVEQELLCRQFATPGTDKFAGIGWRPAPSGAPVLDDAVAWIECSVERVVDAGDHYIVLGRVNRFEAAGLGSPLLFFQGGYGGFRTQSLIAPFAIDLQEQLQVVDVARTPMEHLAGELGIDCYAQALVDDDLVIMAGASGGNTAFRSYVGRRVPFMPPYGSLFINEDDLDLAVDRWISQMASAVSAEQKGSYRRMLETVRERGWSIGLCAPQHDDVTVEVDRYSSVARTPVAERRVSALLPGLAPFYEPAVIDPDEQYDVRILVAPVRIDGRTVLALTLAGMPGGVSASEVQHWVSRLQATAGEVAAALLSTK